MKLKFKIQIILFTTVVFLINFIGCFYSFTGASVPSHLKTLALPFADDRSGSGEAGLRENFTEKLIKKFVDDNSFEITEQGSSDAIIETVIQNINDAPASIIAGESVAYRRITISAKVVYKDLINRKTIFEEVFRAEADYEAADVITGRSEAISKALDLLTEDILLKVVSNW